MNKKVQTDFEQLSEELIDNIINTSDEDILKEVEEEYGVSNYIANNVRNIITKSIKEAGKIRLANARHEMEEEQKKVPPTKKISNDESAIERLDKFLKSNPQYDSEMLIAARNGEKLSEEDAEGILEDLEELKNNSND